MKDSSTKSVNTIMKEKSTNGITAYGTPDVRERLFEVASRFDPHLWDKIGSSLINVLEKD
jgi:hypothetical protein